MENSKIADLYGLTGGAHDDVFWDELKNDAERYRWLADQFKSGALVLHADTLGKLSLWADGLSFEQKIDQALRVRRALEEWQNQTQALSEAGYGVFS